METGYSIKKQLVSVDRLQVVFKIVEQCNINCSYCYYYNMGDQSALERPPVINKNTVYKIAEWLLKGCKDMNINKVSISFHGGEPMMLKPDLFDEICQILTDYLSKVANLSFNIQTNGTILTDKWLDIFCKHRVHVGISIDGDRTAQDRYRLDRMGRSTFDKIEKNIQKMMKVAVTNKFIGPATISVLDYQNNYKDVYNYLRNLGIKRMSFLLPDRNYDAKFSNKEESAEVYGKHLFEIFKAWLREDNKDITVRFIKEFIERFQLYKPEDINNSLETSSHLSLNQKHKNTQIIIVHSDGNVGVSDSYIPALQWFKNAPEYSVQNSSLNQFLNHQIFDEIETVEQSLCQACRDCEWKNICKGGDLENRYSAKNGFDNPSIYCESYLYFYNKAQNFLIEHGYPKDQVEQIKKGKFALAQ